MRWRGHVCRIVGNRVWCELVDEDGVRSSMTLSRAELTPKGKMGPVLGQTFTLRGHELVLDAPLVWPKLSKDELDCEVHRLFGGLEMKCSCEGRLRVGALYYRTPWIRPAIRLVASNIQHHDRYCLALCTIVDPGATYPVGSSMLMCGQELVPADTSAFEEALARTAEHMWPEERIRRMTVA